MLVSYLYKLEAKRVNNNAMLHIYIHTYLVKNVYAYTNTHTHSQTNIYTYIYIYSS